MGNSTSNAANSSLPEPKAQLQRQLSPNGRTLSPNGRTLSPTARALSPAGSPASRVHKSLRTKKKSLELPDLASLALTPASASPNASPHANYRRPRASSPIPIPASPNPPQPTFRVQNNLPSAAHIAGSGNRRYQKSYLSSAYPSSHSFSGREHEQSSPPGHDEPEKHDFKEEVVHSTIPLALVKAECDGLARPEHLSVTIRWRGGGKSVVLARAGDDYWKGRQPMEYDPQAKVWTTQIHVLPGTHHFKFIVDDAWRLAEDYPTAVDDLDGSLANYINATSPNTISPSSSSPHPTPQPTQLNQFASFWSDNSSTREGFGKGEAAWVTFIPPELTNAAAEEENYLASADSPTSSSSVPAPNIPPAPVLPRHLDKLILNVRPNISGAAGSAASSDRERRKEKEKSKRREKEREVRDREREREREVKEREREARTRAVPSTGLGMTSADAGGAERERDERFSPPLALPITTASGTDVSALATSTSSPPTPGGEENGPLGEPSTSPVKTKKTVVSRWDPAGLADDASVLPVPSHVVLHHLSTSAIKNGVLAVANTTRYRKKYITTIYYKPT